MKVHSFMCSYEEKEGLVYLHDKTILHQINRVLHLKEGEHVRLFNENKKNQSIDAEILSISQKELKGIIIKKELLVPPKRNVTLFCAVLKKENFEIVCRKSTELGMTTIVPLRTQRTIKQNLNYKRLEIIMKESAEQSGRGATPELKEIITLNEACLNFKEFEQVFLCQQNGLPISNVELKNTVALCIGPEGGFTDEERDLIKKAKNVQEVSLGLYTLKGETAAIVGGYALLQ